MKLPVIFTLIFFSLCQPAHAADKVRVSVTNYNMSYLAAGVAAKKGFFKEEGLGRRDHPHERQRGDVGA